MASDGIVRVLIADDELLARQRLEDLLSRESDVEIIRTVDNGPSAVEAIKSDLPDLVFLDVQMPGLTGLEVVRAVGPENMPVTIFVTAYDQHALKAFELAAVDYLLKPFEDERFEMALDRARKLIKLQAVGKLTDRLVRLLHGIDTPAARTDTTPSSTQTSYLERIAVEMRGQVRVVPVESVHYILASGPYAELHSATETFVIRERMHTLEERLDPDQFFRIHRSAIVRLDQVEALLNRGGGDCGVRLKSGKLLSVSRNRFEELEQRLGLSDMRASMRDD